MSNWFKVNLTKNKKNGQVNISLPKKQMTPLLRSALAKCKRARIKLEAL